MLIDLLLLVLGLALVVKGGDWFVDSSVHIARHFGIPRMVIGGTLVSLATTTPELVVSVTASAMGDPGIALGNAVGSAIANIALIIGILALLGTVTVEPKIFRIRSLWMLASTFLVILFTWQLSLSRPLAAVLLLLALAYLVADYLAIRRGKKVGIPAGIKEEFQEEVPLKKSFLLFGAGALLVIIGSRLLVISGINLATALGIPSVVIGLTVIAVGTSLPELVTAVSASRKGVPDLSVGNIVGANVLDLALIVGLAGFVHPLTLSEFTRNYSYSWLVAVTLAMMIIFWRNGEARKKQGIFLLFLYTCYVLGLISLYKP